MNSLRPRLRAIYKGFLRREKIYVFERILDSPCSKIEAKIEVNVRLAQRDDFPKISQTFKKFNAVSKDRFQMNHMCIVAEVGGDIVHLVWVAFNEAYTRELEKKLRIDFDSAYLYDAYTVPERRGLGILPKAMAEAFGYLYVKGIRKVYTCVPHNNFSSLRAVHKVGFRRIGAMTFTRILELKLYQCKGETEQNYFKLKKMFSL